jgi:U4/U6.U5 tri-snRNP-associated protein 2
VEYRSLTWIEVSYQPRPHRHLSTGLIQSAPLAEIKTTKSPFLFLAIDLPPRPVFQGVIEKDIIPQVPIDQVLAKYDGVTTQEAKGIIRRFKITRLPPFLILHIKRFTKNNFVEEKNPTIVNYPLRGVDMQDCKPRPTFARPLTPLG